MRLPLAVVALLTLALPLGAADPEPGGVLVLTAEARDYVFGAGGTLAKMAAEGKPVYIVHFGNGEKDASGLKPSEARLAHEAEAKKAAAELGAKETLFLGHKSGELAYLSSSELRNQAIMLTRFYKPEILFFPDWYVHYLPDDDTYRVGRMAEESPYGGGDYFLQEGTYMGLEGYAARQYYFYSPQRPYRPREGGEGKAQFVGVDVGATFDKKLAAALALETPNRRYAEQVQARLAAAGRLPSALSEITPRSIRDLVATYLEELAETIGERHGFARAEEFNHLGLSPGVPEHIRERAVEIGAQR